ncbi:hypothetical protein Lal_00027191 [Lupinus albus]|nr:hypothetical protein Lal_00027191 [Lupinus albus]
MDSHLKRKNKKEKKNDTISKWMRMKNVAILHPWMFITRTCYPLSHRSRDNHPNSLKSGLINSAFFS